MTGESASVPFIESVQSCFSEFLASLGNPESVVVITTLRSGQQFASIGLNVRPSPAGPTSLMLLGTQELRAFVVRDSDITAVEFQVIDEPGDDAPTPFGFFPRPAS